MFMCIEKQHKNKTAIQGKNNVTIIMLQLVTINNSVYNEQKYTYINKLTYNLYIYAN